jgi:16S rRNA (cytidine1402-2'-O)-methyltransferase
VTVYLIPSLLHETAIQSIPSYILNAVRDCKVLFVENERTARRFLKSLSKEIIIDDFVWVTVHKVEEQIIEQFRQFLKEGNNIGIISEAGCPGIADPGQILVQAAHRAGATVKPLVGPNSILLALMASGLNGQQFQFVGYLPIDIAQRVRTIKSLEEESARKKCTQIFIETPYRNNALFESLIKTLRPSTFVSIAANLTGPDEFIRTYPVSEWKKQVPDLHKKPAIFSLLA